MASLVVTQLRPILTPSISPLRNFRAMKLGDRPLSWEAFETEISFEVKSLIVATLALVSTLIILIS